MDKQAVRRKLLKGSLSAPLVMTVSPVLANARTSFSRCLANAQTISIPEVMADNANDEWLRAPVQVHKNVKVMVEGNWQVQQGEFFQAFDQITYRLPDRAAATPTPVMWRLTDPVNVQTIGQPQTKYALAWVNDRGTVVGTGWQRGTGSFVQRSCYSSLVAQAAR